MEKKKLSVWWIPQIPMKSFRVEVPDIEYGKLLLRALAHYDLFQLENNIKPDFSNAGGLDEWDDDTKDWVTWEDEDGYDIDDLMRAEEGVDDYQSPIIKD